VNEEVCERGGLCPRQRAAVKSAIGVHSVRPPASSTACRASLGCALLPVEIECTASAYFPAPFERSYTC